MDHTGQPARILSLCTGYAGAELGLREVLPGGCHTVAYVEIEAFAVRNLVEKIQAGILDAAPIHTDVKSFPFGQFRGVVDILTGGFPCQPFSSNGGRLADADPRHLFPFVKHGIDACRPDYVLLENVEGILSAKLSGDGWNDPAGTPVLLHVLRELERIGYECTYGMFTAAEVGLPHLRKRIFILGRRYGAAPLAYSDHERLEGLSEYVDAPSGAQERSPGQASVGRFPAAPRGAAVGQYGWEPPRVVRPGGAMANGNREGQLQPPGSVPEGGRWPDNEGDEGGEGRGRQAESEMGRGPDGSPDRAYDAELRDYCRQLYVSANNIEDETRLLGNGIVPAMAAKAFVTLMEELENGSRAT